MPSPFPGMDPYLEAPDWWRGFHHNLATEIQARISPLLPPHYYPDVEVYLPYSDEGEVRLMAPDVYVARTRAVRERQTAEFAVALAGLTLLPAPLELTVPIEPPEKSYAVNIYDARDNLLVTAIEILSPANKRPGSEAFYHYRRKRARLLLSSVHLMEIDLLRNGERPSFAEPLPEAPYFVSLSRADRRPVAEVWPLGLLEPIPPLPIPLLPPDPDLPLDLGAAIAQVYERGRYSLRIDYTLPPPPPALAAQEQAWLADRLRAAEGS